MSSKFKCHFFTLSFLLLSLNGFSQGLFQILLDKANKALNEKINSISNKVINASINGLENKINGKFTVVSNRINQSNATNRIVNNTTTKQVDDNSEIIEKQLKDKYPSFYKAYKDVISNNSNVKEVLFIVMDTHEWTSRVIDDKIYIDVYAFDERKKGFSEGAKIWELLYQVSYLNTINNSTLPNTFDKINANFIYALTKSKEYAENGDCTSLKHAVTVWKFKNFVGPNSINYREKSRNSLIKEDLFKQCESLYLTKCGK
jgi:hypothetical protein